METNLGQPCEIKYDIGANCTIICGVTIGQSAFVGVVLINRDVKPCFDGWCARQANRLDE